MKRFVFIGGFGLSLCVKMEKRTYKVLFLGDL